MNKNKEPSIQPLEIAEGVSEAERNLLEDIRARQIARVIRIEELANREYAVDTSGGVMLEDETTTVSNH